MDGWVALARGSMEIAFGRSPVAERECCPGCCENTSSWFAADARAADHDDVEVRGYTSCASAARPRRKLASISSARGSPIAPGVASLPRVDPVNWFALVARHQDVFAACSFGGQVGAAVSPVFMRLTSRRVLVTPDVHRHVGRGADRLSVQSASHGPLKAADPTDGLL